MTVTEKIEQASWPKPEKQEYPASKGFPFWPVVCREAYRLDYRNRRRYNTPEDGYYRGVVSHMEPLLLRNDVIVIYVPESMLRWFGEKDLAELMRICLAYGGAPTFETTFVTGTRPSSLRR